MMKKRTWLILAAIAAILLLVYISPRNITTQFQPNSILDYQNHYNIAVHYPVTGEQQSDQKIQAFIDSEVASFRAEYANYTAYSDDDKAMLHITYQCYNRFATHIKFSVEKQDKYGKETKVHIIAISGISVRPKETRQQNLPPKTRELDHGRPMVAITFDDGPGSHTERILELLEQNGAKATFFVLGLKAEGYPDLVRQMYAAGHEIGNHTYDHKQLTKLGGKELEAQIQKTQDVIQEITGKAPALLRPTYGSFNQQVRANHMPIIMWNVDTLDWKSKNADSVYQHVIKSVKDGDIILFHDTFESTEKAIERLLPELTAKGYQLVTVSELMAAKQVPLEPGRVYYSQSRSK